MMMAGTDGFEKANPSGSGGTILPHLQLPNANETDDQRCLLHVFQNGVKLDLRLPVRKSSPPPSKSSPQLKSSIKARTPRSPRVLVKHLQAKPKQSRKVSLRNTPIGQKICDLPPEQLETNELSAQRAMKSRTITRLVQLVERMKKCTREPVEVLLVVKETISSRAARYKYAGWGKDLKRFERQQLANCRSTFYEVGHNDEVIVGHHLPCVSTPKVTPKRVIIVPGAASSPSKAQAGKLKPTKVSSVGVERQNAGYSCAKARTGTDVKRNISSTAEMSAKKKTKGKKREERLISESSDEEVSDSEWKPPNKKKRAGLTKNRKTSETSTTECSDEDVSTIEVVSLQKRENAGRRRVKKMVPAVLSEASEDETSASEEMSPQKKRKKRAVQKKDWKQTAASSVSTEPATKAGLMEVTEYSGNDGQVVKEESVDNITSRDDEFEALYQIIAGYEASVTEDSDPVASQGGQEPESEPKPESKDAETRFQQADHVPMRKIYAVKSKHGNIFKESDYS